MIRFLAPWALPLLLLLPALVAAYVALLRRRRRLVLRFATLEPLKEALGRQGWRRHVPPALLLMGLAVAAWLSSNDLINVYGDGVAHLNIARKVVDAAPGASLWTHYVQLRSPWLPAQHVLMLPFVWIDPLWRSGWAGTSRHWQASSWRYGARIASHSKVINDNLKLSTEQSTECNIDLGGLVILSGGPTEAFYSLEILAGSGDITLGTIGIGTAPGVVDPALGLVRAVTTGTVYLDGDIAVKGDGIDVGNSRLRRSKTGCNHD